MKMRHLMIFGLFSFAALISSCDKDDEETNEEEVITTVRVKLTEAATTTPQIFTFRDVDGPGGAAPTQDSIIINANKQYEMAVEFLDESKTPAEDITKEVAEEAADHQVYYAATGVNITVSNLNTDLSGLPLGLTSRWVTGAVGRGSMKVTLKHKPGIKAAGDPVTKGETDIEVDFGVRLR